MLKTIIVDDEPNSRDKLELLLKQYCSDKIENVAICKNGQEGLAAIEVHHPDLVFLDVEMPVLTGFDMLKKLPSINFEVIFTTAHDHYAIKAIKFSALDYLLKPVDLEQLQDAINKAMDKKGMGKAASRYENFVDNLKSPMNLSSLSIPTSDGFMLQKIEDIVWLEAINYYCVFHLAGKQEIIATRTLKDFEEMLAESNFIRIHHSHMINLQHMKRYIKGSGGQVEMSDGRTLDVSRRRKDELMTKINY